MRVRHKKKGGQLATLFFVPENSVGTGAGLGEACLLAGEVVQGLGVFGQVERGDGGYPVRMVVDQARLDETVLLVQSIKGVLVIRHELFELI